MNGKGSRTLSLVVVASFLLNLCEGGHGCLSNESVLRTYRWFLDDGNKPEYATALPLNATQALEMFVPLVESC